MKVSEFKTILNKCCKILTEESRKAKFTTAKIFENRVRSVLSDLISYDTSIKVDFNSPDQAFPDIALGEFGVEVKFTTLDTWRCIGNSIQETQRVENVKYIYLIYGKMGGIPEVRWSDYDKSIIHVRTSHVPRFEVEIPDVGKNHESLFNQIGITYDKFRQLKMNEKMKYIRAYAKKIHPDGRLWWIDDTNIDSHTLPIDTRLYTKLSDEEKKRYRAEAAIISPKIVKSGRDRNKYDEVVLFLLTYHGIICHQARDLFSAGSVANPKNDDFGGIYIARALKLIEPEMKIAAYSLPEALFIEYWGEKVPPERRISRWLEIADKLAKDWKPSEVLFRD